MASSTPLSLRVLIADDEPIMRDVARMACEEHGVQVIGEAANGLQAVEETLRLRPDILVLDLDLHDIDGFEVSRRLRAAGCTVRILGTTGEGGPPAVFRAIRTGIGGVLSRSGVATSLAGALRALAADGGAMSPQQQDQAVAQLGLLLSRTRRQAAIAACLTPRERAVLALVVEGLTTRQMASRLGVAEQTVRSHLSAAYRKLSVRTRVQAAARALDAGIADLGSGPQPGPARPAATATN